MSNSLSRAGKSNPSPPPFQPRVFRPSRLQPTVDDVAAALEQASHSHEAGAPEKIPLLKYVAARMRGGSIQEEDAIFLSRLLCLSLPWKDRQEEFDPYWGAEVHTAGDTLAYFYGGGSRWTVRRHINHLVEVGLLCKGEKGALSVHCQWSGIWLMLEWWLFFLYGKGLLPARHALILAWADNHYWRDGRLFYVAERTMAAAFHRSPSTIGKDLDSLSQCGALITRTGRVPGVGVRRICRPGPLLDPLGYQFDPQVKEQWKDYIRAARKLVRGRSVYWFGAQGGAKGPVGMEQKRR